MGCVVSRTVVTGSISQHSSNNLTWLQRQQQKLRDRKEWQLRWEREATEGRLLAELRTRPSPSRRPDGYTSDTTHIDCEDEDAEDFSVPLHVNTGGGKHGGGSAPVSPLLPHRTSSSTRRVATLTRHSPSERPFVAVKRAHEQARKYSQSDHDSGLLSMVDGEGNDALGSLIASLAVTRTSSSNSSDDTSTNPWPPPPSESQLRDEGYSWRTTSTSDGTGSPGNSPRPQTPAFPVHPRTPYSNSSHSHFDTAGLPPKSPTAQRKEWSPVGEILLKERDHSTTSSLRGYESSDQHSPKSPGLSGLPNGTLNGGHTSPSPTVYYGHSRRSSVHSNSEPPQEVSPAHVKFVRDTSRYWYKPTISREEAIAMLRDQSPGTFVVRDSNSFPGAFGLALKVATPPPNTTGKSPSSDPANELVRHFLIEPTSRGVRLKGCANEPVFSSLSALVYQHSLLPLALPCRLVLPESDLSKSNDPTGTMTNAQMLLAQGAACNVLYLMTVDTESLTGPQAIARAMTQLFSGTLPTAAVIHFKVSGQGITLTDNKRQLFFRRHYPVNTISYCGLDPDDRRWSYKGEAGMSASSFRCFGFVARKPASKSDNQCHVFAELEPGQPATAIVNFVSKVMMSNNQAKANIV
ncbi:hypothetical protein AAG570_001452 [Ranatra chinensis]|uniref:SH2 domain-containing protein n=1 Tax=Ranatra chinensis TaxID=642074 RepID=A0ABD0YAJ1_9HEMI